MKSGEAFRRHHLDEPELIARAKSGDHDAYGEIVRRFQDVAFRVAYVITGSAEDAEEATQDGFVRAYFALDRFKFDAPFRPWLLTIVANSARNRRKSSRTRYALPLDNAPELVDLTATPEHQVIDRERRESLLFCLDQLRSEDRDVIVCRYFLDLTETEMASVLGVARGTVKSRLSRALARTRTAMQLKRLDHE